MPSSAKIPVSLSIRHRGHVAINRFTQTSRSLSEPWSSILGAPYQLCRRVTLRTERDVSRNECLHIEMIVQIRLIQNLNRARLFVVDDLIGFQLRKDAAHGLDGET